MAHVRGSAYSRPAFRRAERGTVTRRPTFLNASLPQEALREERADKEHWRDEAKQLRELLAASKREPEVILAVPEIVPSAPTPEPNVLEGPALMPVAEAEFGRLSTETAPAQSAAPGSPFRWWGRLFA